MMAIKSRLVVLWRVTEACDLPCPFCAYSRDLRRPRQAVEPESVLAFGKLLGEYARATGREVLVSWLGGEPLLWKPLFELSHIFKHEFGLQVSVTTNGTRLGEAKVRECLLADFDEVTVSLDGIGADHDACRQTAGLYGRVEEGVRRLQAGRQGNTPRLRVNTILMRSNIHQFEALCRTVAEWGVNTITFNGLGGRDRPEYFSDHHLLPEQIEVFRRELTGIRERMARLGLTILGNEHYLDRLQATSLNNQLLITDCSPGQTFLFIDEHSTIAPCSFTGSEYGVEVSEIRTVGDLANLPAYFAKRRQEAIAAICYDCPSTQVFGKFASPLSPTPPPFLSETDRNGGGESRGDRRE